jgi:DNA-binding transcriptional ArsR family regulator
MSVKAISWALADDRVANTSARFVLVILANYADENGVSFPSVETIRTKTKLTRSSVFRLLDVLREAERVYTIERRDKNGRQRSTLYALNLADDYDKLVADCQPDEKGKFGPPLNAIINALGIDPRTLFPGKKYGVRNSDSVERGPIDASNGVRQSDSVRGPMVGRIYEREKDLNETINETTPPAKPATDSRIGPLMKIHADRIGTVNDGSVQAATLKTLLKRYTPDDLADCYRFQVSQLRTEGGWRDAVSWKTVSAGVAEWIVAGKPRTDRDVRTRPKAVDTFGRIEPADESWSAAYPYPTPGPDDFGGEDFPAADLVRCSVCGKECCFELHRPDDLETPASNAGGGVVVDIGRAENRPN